MKKLLRVIISFSLIAFLLSQADLLGIWEAIRSSDPVFLCLAFSLIGVGYLLSSLRWQVLLQAQGFTVPYLYLVRSNVIAKLFNNVLPSTIGGDAYRSLDVAKMEIPKLQSFTVVFVERFLGGYAIFIYALSVLTVSSEISFHIQYLWVWVLIAFAGLNFVLWTIFFHRGHRLIQVSYLKEALLPFRGKKRALIIGFLISLLFQLNVIVHHFWISEALGLTVPFYKFFIIVPMAVIVQMLPVSINGIGIRESFFVFVFTKIYGIPIEESLAFSAIVYGMLVASGLIGGLVLLLRKEPVIEEE